MGGIMNDKGFTLIELILVIAILGILAVAAMPKIFSLTTDSINAQAEGLLGGLQSAVALKEAQQYAKTGNQINWIGHPGFDSVPFGQLCANTGKCFAGLLKDPVAKSWKKVDKNNYQQKDKANCIKFSEGTGTFAIITCP
jgi:prepilin-type N-terminal cleavage/methylation domain-containing protein